jgi:hypothetical protein
MKPDPLAIRLPHCQLAKRNFDIQAPDKNMKRLAWSRGSLM